MYFFDVFIKKFQEKVKVKIEIKYDTHKIKEDINLLKKLFLKEMPNANIANIHEINFVAIVNHIVMLKDFFNNNTEKQYTSVLELTDEITKKRLDQIIIPTEINDYENKCVYIHEFKNFKKEAKEEMNFQKFAKIAIIQILVNYLGMAIVKLNDDKTIPHLVLRGFVIYKRERNYTDDIKEADDEENTINIVYDYRDIKLNENNDKVYDCHIEEIKLTRSEVIKMNKEITKYKKQLIKEMKEMKKPIIIDDAFYKTLYKHIVENFDGKLKLIELLFADECLDKIKKKQLGENEMDKKI